VALRGTNHKGWPKGKKRPKEFGELISAKLKGRTASDDAKANMSKSRKGKKRKPASDETKNKISMSLKGRHLSEDHKNKLRGPRKHLPDYQKEKISKANKISWADPENRKKRVFAIQESMMKRSIAFCKNRGVITNYKGFRLKSSWELAFAKRLDHLGVKWDYEVRRFRLQDRRVYAPDFFLIEQKEFIEIKGFWFGDAKEKFETFLLEFPEVKISVLDSMQKINNWGGS
jgi:hypothetical protein